MRLRARGGDELGGAAEERVVADRRHHALHVALLGDGAGIGDVADRLADRQRFAGQGRLIDGQVSAAGQEKIRGHDRAGGDVGHVADDEIRRVDAFPFAVAQTPGLQRQALPQRRERARGLRVLPEADRGVVDREPEYDDEVRPVPPRERDQRGGLDHPRDRSPEVAEKLVPERLFLGDDRIWTVPGESGLGFVGGQARRRTLNFGELRGDSGGAERLGAV